MAIEGGQKRGGQRNESRATIGKKARSTIAFGARARASTASKRLIIASEEKLRFALSESKEGNGTKKHGEGKKGEGNGQKAEGTREKETRERENF